MHLSNAKTQEEHTWAPSTLSKKGVIRCSEKVSIIVLMMNSNWLSKIHISLVFLSKTL